MRVTNSMLVDGAVAAMQDAMARMGVSQSRLATGRQLQTPADDPAGHAAATRIQARVTATEQYTRQGTQALSVLTATDRSLAQLHDLLTRAGELAVAGANDSNNATDRAAIAAEVNALLVGAGIPVTGLALERPTLEEVVLAAAGTSTDRVEARR